MNEEIKKQTEDIINKLLSKRYNKKKSSKYELFEKIEKPEIKEEIKKEEEPIKIEEKVEEKPKEEIKENKENDHNLKKEENIIEPINNLNNTNLLKKNFDIEETSLPSINSFNKSISSLETSSESSETKSSLYTTSENSNNSKEESLPSINKNNEIMSDTSSDNSSTSSEEEINDSVSEVTDYEYDKDSNLDNESNLKYDEEENETEEESISSIESVSSNEETEEETDNDDYVENNPNLKKPTEIEPDDETTEEPDDETTVESEETNVIYKPVFKKQKIIEVPITIKNTTEALEKDEIKDPSSYHYPRPSSPYNLLQNLNDPVEKKSEVPPTLSSFSSNNYQAPVLNQQPKNVSIPYHQPVLPQKSFSNNFQNSQTQKKKPRSGKAL